MLSLSYLWVEALEVLLGGAVGHVRAVPQAGDADLPELGRRRVAVQPLPGIQDLRIEMFLMIRGTGPFFRNDVQLASKEVRFQVHRALKAGPAAGRYPRVARSNGPHKPAWTTSWFVRT